MIKMKHAGDQALDALEPILKQVRMLPGLKERKRGAFYHQSSGFLHFHEDPAGFFADLKRDGNFVRFPVNTREEIASFIREVKRLTAE